MSKNGLVNRQRARPSCPWQLKPADPRLDLMTRKYVRPYPH